MLELLENHSVPERTTDLKAHGQLEDIDSPDRNHFTRRGLRSPRGSLIVSCDLTDIPFFPTQRIYSASMVLAEVSKPIF